MTLFSAVPPEQIRQAQVVTGFVLAAFIGSGVIPGLRPYVRTIRLVLLVAYLLGCAAFIGWVLVK